MRTAKSKQFEKDYVRLPQHIQKKVNRQLKFLASDIKHPSIRTKKITKTKDIWEGRVNRFYRLTFQIEKDEIYLRRVGTHDKALKSP